ncbi:hypothetical protein [Candidatus Nitrosotenuis sp. DW1]|nr:hypothetical protein [Candidatus Nitrosotenuis sp. DW1]
MSCKSGYIHVFTWFPLQGKRLCTRCMEEEAPEEPKPAKQE